MASNNEHQNLHSSLQNSIEMAIERSLGETRACVLKLIKFQIVLLILILVIQIVLLANMVFVGIEYMWHL